MGPGGTEMAAGRKSRSVELPVAALLLGEWRSWQEWGIGKLGLSGTVVPITNVTGLVPQCPTLLTALAHPGGSEGTERTCAGEREVTEGLSCLEFRLEHPCLLLDI